MVARVVATFGVAALLLPGLTIAKEVVSDASSAVKTSVIETVESRSGQSVRELSAGESGVYAVSRDKLVGLPPIESLFGYYQKVVTIQFTGVTTPDALVTVNVGSDAQKTYATQADTAGQWVVAFDANDLQEGSYDATMRTSVKDAASDTRIIGSFVVHAEKRMTNTTWIAFILFSAVCMLFLIITNIVVFLRRS